MSKKPLCIITDRSVQYSNKNFPGIEFIKLSPICFSLKNITYKNSTHKNKLIRTQFETNVNQNALTARNLKDISNQVIEQLEDFQNLVFILHSQYLSNAYDIAIQLIQKIPDKNRVHLFDSNSFSYGLGLIVKKAAGLINKGIPIEKIIQTIRNTIPHVYGIFISPNHSRLAYPGFLTYEQAIALDLLGQIPVFTIEEGRFNPFGKVNKIRNGILLIEEFIDEFEEIEDLILISGIQSRSREVAQLRNHCLDSFPHVKFSHQPINDYSAVMIGPNALGVFVLEKVKT